MYRLVGVAIALTLMATGGSYAKSKVHAHHIHRPHHTAVWHHSHHVFHAKRFKRLRISLPIEERPSNIVTVPTAAGIPIKVAQNLAAQFQGFIKDLVDLGYKPKSIGCFATSGHVRNSNHYHGGACDFDQTGWNKTAPTMYHVRDLATKWHLRDGCSFRRSDCGHIDDGRNISWKYPRGTLQRYINYQTSPNPDEASKTVLEKFEE